MFVEFTAVESDIACDPITSIAAQEPTEKSEKKEKPQKKTQAKTFSTQSKEVTKKDETKPPTKSTTTKQEESQSTAKPTKSKEGENGTETKRDPICYLCKQKHFLSLCPEFRNLHVNDRRAFLDSKKMCGLCLNKGHSNDDCQRTFLKCVVCSGDHHTLTHMDKDEAEAYMQAQAAMTEMNPEADEYVSEQPIRSQVHYSSTSR